MHPLWLAAPLTFFRSDQWEARTPSRLSTCSPTAIDPSEKTPGDGDGSIATWHGRATDGSIGGRLQQEMAIGRWGSHLPRTSQSKVTKVGWAGNMLQASSTTWDVLDASKNRMQEPATTS